MTTALEKAQAKRIRRANNKSPSKYALYNVTEEATKEREEINARIQETRDAREASRTQETDDEPEHEHSENCDHEH